ncbi:hypothetical protein D9M72_351730 [compost metagenome]
MASANENAMGTPESTVAATTTTKKITRLNLPSVANSGAASQKAPTSAAMPSTATAICRPVHTRTRRSTAITSMMPMPAGMAAARQALLISSAGVTMNDSSCA